MDEQMANGIGYVAADDFHTGLIGEPSVVQITRRLDPFFCIFIFIEVFSAFQFMFCIANI